MSLKQFVLKHKLGQGAYSVVYKVERIADHETYALKKVKLNNLSAKQIENALNEVRILASIKNNHIVGYKQAFMEGKNLCIVMQYVNNGDLYQRITQQKKNKEYIQQKQIWKTLMQILIALNILHKLNILHRDLKSANIFLNLQGQIKLGDMNVSKITQNGLLYTQTGTPYYASPQVWNDMPYDSKSDIWSLGCVIYEMTKLEPPFQANDMEGLFKAVTLGAYPPISKKYSKALGHIIKLMLDLKPKARPSAHKILVSNIMRKKIEEYGFKYEYIDQKNELLNTIKVPKKLHYLTDRLPKPNYSVKQTAMSLKNCNIKQTNSLPRLVYKQLNSKQTEIYKQHNQRVNRKKESKRGVNHIVSRNCSKLKKKKKSECGLIIEGQSKLIESLHRSEQYRRNIQNRYKQEDKTKLPKIKI